MFSLYGNDRLTHWKKFRNSLESSNTPLEDVINFWSLAPFVSPYLNPQNPAEWPDAWHLILDDRFDDLAIVLGMLYTIKLTTRFMETQCEIHTSMFPKEKYPRYLLIVDNKHVLNFEYGCISGIEKLTEIETSLIWAK